MSASQLLYTAREAEILGRRRVCYDEGHRLHISIENHGAGGVQGAPNDPRSGISPAACDRIKCLRCDAVFNVTYSEIGREP